MIARHAEDPAKVRRYAGMMGEAAARAASITRRLLALARRGDLIAESVEVAPLLQGLREFLIHTLGPNVALHVTALPGLPPVFVDKGQLETALVNLATNARDAIAGNGAIAFAADLEPLPQGRDATALAPGDYVRITVADTGMGMDAAMIDRAMEPFFTTKQLGKGTGLGLPMARGFAEQSGGALEVESVVGRGTTVSIWLPIAAASADALPLAETTPAKLVVGKKRVMLVEDEDGVRETLKGMPGIDGLALIRAVQEKRRGLPAILLTGFAGDAATLAIGIPTSGSICLLRKPITGAELADRAAMMLEQSDAEIAFT